MLFPGPCYYKRGGRDVRETHHEVVQTEWRPPPGLSPRMREFECLHCHKKLYRPLTMHELGIRNK